MEPNPILLAELLPLALIPFACFHLSRFVSRTSREAGTVSFAGSCFAFVGSLFKAAWILVFLAFSTDARLLDNLHFVFSMPAAILIAWAFWSEFRAQGRVPVWVVPVITISILGGTSAVRALTKGGNSWYLVLFGSTVLACTVLSVMLIRESALRRMSLHSFLLTLAAFLLLLQLGLPYDNNNYGPWLAGQLAASAGWLEILNFARRLSA